MEENNATMPGAVSSSLKEDLILRDNADAAVPEVSETVSASFEVSPDGPKTLSESPESPSISSEGVPDGMEVVPEPSGIVSEPSMISKEAAASSASSEPMSTPLEIVSALSEEESLVSEEESALSAIALNSPETVSKPSEIASTPVEARTPDRLEILSATSEVVLDQSETSSDETSETLPNAANLESIPSEVDEPEASGAVQRRFYQAIGTIEGIVTLEEPSRITIEDRDYPIIYLPLVRKKLQVGQLQRFQVYPVVLGEQLGFKLLRVGPPNELGFTLKGSWIEGHNGPVFVIYRNEPRGESDQMKPKFLNLVWEDAPAPEGRFWELKAQLQEAGLVVTAVEGPFLRPRRWLPKKPKRPRFIPPVPEEEASATPRPKPAPPIKRKDRPAPPPVTHPSEPPAPLPVLSPEEIRAMAVTAKVEVTCKITEMPPHRTTLDKQVEFFLTDGDRILTVRLKPKQFKKLTKHEFETWIGVITGQIGPATETGFELINVGVQVFERKAKESQVEASESGVAQEPEAKSAPQPLARPQTPAASAKQGRKQVEETEQPAASGRKNLMRHVMVR